uniref:Uncharacterized protein n=1 Tax=Sipha flava TaxID=143950 RepID=A0A2S2Q0H1_9HEMI
MGTLFNPKNCTLLLAHELSIHCDRSRIHHFRIVITTKQNIINTIQETRIDAYKYGSRINNDPSRNDITSYDDIKCFPFVFVVCGSNFFSNIFPSFILRNFT